MTIASRIVALVVAVGLVVGALVLRQARTGDGGDPDDGGVADAGGDGVRLTCPSDLEALCDGLARTGRLRTTGVGTATTATAAGGAVLDDPWLVPVAWADVVDDERTRGGLAALRRSDVVARSPVVVGVWEDRLEALTELCGLDDATFRLGCLDGVADQRWEALGHDPRWGRVNVGHDDPTTTTGLTVTAAVVGGVAGPDFGQTELRDPTTARALRAVEAFAVAGDPTAGGYLRSMVVTGESAADVAVATEAEAVGLDLARLPGNVVVVRPAVPALQVELVVVADDEAALARAVDALEEVGPGPFEAAGWRADGPPAGTPVGDLPTPAPRPDGPSLTALLLFWDDLDR